MHTNYYRKYCEQVLVVLDKMRVSDLQGQKLDGESGLEQWCSYTKNLADKDNTIYFIGNGASAMMASHMAADGSKNAKFKALAFNDAAFLTAVSNDECYEQSFATPLARFARAEDMLISISSSGNSPNILKAIDVARKIGLLIITLSGMSEDNQSRKLGDLNFYVPATTYGITECSHQVILHCWLDRYMQLYRT